VDYMDWEKSSLRTKKSGTIIANRVIIFALVYGLLMAAWPAISVAYLKFYRVTGEFLFGSFGHGGIVYFSPSEKTRDEIDIIALNQHRMNKNGQTNGLRLYHNVRYGDYMNAAFLTALIAATPLSLRHKGWAFLWGLILMHIIIFFKSFIAILNLFSKEPLSLFILSPFWKSILVTANKVIADPLTPGFVSGFVIAFFIWILVSFRRDDLKNIILDRQEPARWPSIPTAKAKVGRT